MELRKCPNHARTGGILLPAVVTIAVLGVVAAIALNTMQAKYRLAFQTASWQESLLTAEAAVEVGINEVRRTVLNKPDISTDDPFLASNGWTYFATPEFNDSNNNGQFDPAAGEVWDPATNDTNGNGIADALPNWTFSSQLPHRGTEGGRDSRYLVTADVPLRHPDNQEPYYRLRAWGQMDIPGGAVVAGEKVDNWLRMLSLRNDRRTGKSVGDQPYARRYIETVLKPVSAFRLALFGLHKINMTSENILVDSWDSSNKAKYPGGLYPSEMIPRPSDAVIASLRQENADIATNGDVINASGAHIHGDAATNGGTKGNNGVLDGDNVTGDITNDFQQEVFSVRSPIVTNAEDVGQINTTRVLTATPGSVKTYKASAVKLMGGSPLTPETLTFVGDPTKDTYAQLIVSGDINVSGNAQIVVGPRVFLRIFVEGDATIAGNGFVNPNDALNLQIYGVDTNPDGTPRGEPGEPVGTITLTGNGGFKGAVYAPSHNLAITGGGTADNVFGSFTALDIRMTGVQQLHYDESLSRGGIVVDYKIASWFEDIR